MPPQNVYIFLHGIHLSSAIDNIYILMKFILVLNVVCKGVNSTFTESDPCSFKSWILQRCRFRRSCWETGERW